MHFGFALDSLDLWNIDLLDTHLDLWDTGIPVNFFFCLQDGLKTSWRCLQDMSSRRVEDVFSVIIFRLPRRLQDILRDVFKYVLEDKKFLHWRRVEDVLKTCLEDVFKTSWRPTNVCWVLSLNAAQNKISECILWLVIQKNFYKEFNRLMYVQMS